MVPNLDVEVGFYGLESHFGAYAPNITIFIIYTVNVFKFLNLNLNM